MKYYRTVLIRNIRHVCGGDDPRIYGAEIGVARGKTSQYLLTRLPDLRLFLVDSWAAAEPGSPYAITADAFASSTAAMHEGRFQEMLQRVTAVDHHWRRAKVFRMPSVAAANQLRDGELDFVFIDADHSYEGCKADLEAWYPKVRSGGLFCGHDYTDEPRSPAFGVQRAVDEFVEREKLTLIEDEASIWWTIKP